jgi:hypothetical protein
MMKYLEENMAYNMDLEDRIEELGEPVKRVCVYVKRAFLDDIDEYACKRSAEL